MSFKKPGDLKKSQKKLSLRVFKLVRNVKTQFLPSIQYFHIYLHTSIHDFPWKTIKKSRVAIKLSLVTCNALKRVGLEIMLLKFLL